MTYALSRVFILMIWLIKWVIIKTRLIFPAIFVVVVLGFFRDWYSTNELLTYVLFAAIIAGVAVSWIITLINIIKTNKRWHKRDKAYAYRIAGEPLIATKRANG